jgi:predicted DNA binding CopG/RHH family protein
MADLPVKTVAMGFKVTPEQYKAIEQRAAHNGMRLGTWMRSILLQAASQKPRKGYLRIREPDGATS